MSIYNPLITDDEIIAKGDELIGDAMRGNSDAATREGDLRRWYDALLAERTAKRNTIDTPGGVLIAQQGIYDITYTQHRFGGRPDKDVTLRGWAVVGRAGFSQSYVVLFKNGRQRELTIRDITKVEVAA